MFESVFFQTLLPLWMVASLFQMVGLFVVSQNVWVKPVFVYTLAWSGFTFYSFAVFFREAPTLLAALT